MRRAPRIFELLSLFVAIPAAVRSGLVPLPKLAVLLLMAAGCAVLLWRDPTFDRRALTRLPAGRPVVVMIAARAMGAAGIIVAVVLWRGGNLRAPPGPGWPFLAALVVLYPIFSVWPQELLYRSYFFHRYGMLLGGPGSVVGSGLAFAVLHMVYADPIAPALALPAGLVLAWSYRRTGSLLAVTIEHALYGIAVFALGLGRAFFIAAS